MKDLLRFMKTADSVVGSLVRMEELQVEEDQDYNGWIVIARI